MNNININYIIIFLIIGYLVYTDTFPILSKKIKKQENMMSLDDIPPIDIQPKLEISRLEKCEPILMCEYNTTFNHVINDGKKVYIDTLKPLQNRLIYDGHRYNLSKIEFNIGTTKFEGKKVPLELHFVNNSTVNDYILRIVYPLKLTESREVFSNVYAYSDFNKMNKKIKNKEKSINLLDLQDIPSYICCSPNVGKLKRLDFNSINCMLNKTKEFYRYEPTEKSIWFYNKPINFSKIVGKRIINNLQK